MDKFLIFNLTDINSHQKDFYIYLQYQFQLTSKQFLNFNSQTKSLTIITYINTNAKPMTAAADEAGVSRQTWSSHIKGYETILTIVDTPSSFLSHSLFQEMAVKMDGMSLLTKNALWRTYCYIYYMDGKFGGKFQYSQEQMAKELGTSIKYLNQAIRRFEEWGWLVKKGKFKFSGDNTFAYVYSIPQQYKNAFKLRDDE